MIQLFYLFFSLLFFICRFESIADMVGVCTNLSGDMERYARARACVRACACVCVRVRVRVYMCVQFYRYRPLETIVNLPCFPHSSCSGLPRL